MGLLSSLLLLLGLLWLVQMTGTYFQMRHYQGVLNGITREGGEGYVGAGNAKARFGKGVVVILVSGEDEVIKRAMRMRGITVFARFKEAPSLVGSPLDSLRGDDGYETPYEKTTMLAARRATEQIDRIRTEREMGATVV